MILKLGPLVTKQQMNAIRNGFLKCSARKSGKEVIKIIKIREIIQVDMNILETYCLT